MKQPGPLWDLLAPQEVSLAAQTVKSPPAMQETWVQSLGWEDSFKKGMVTHSRGWVGESCLENPMDRGAWWATAHGVAQSWIRLSD